MATSRAVIGCSLLASLTWLTGCGDDHPHQHGGASGYQSELSYYIDTNATVPQSAANPPGLGAALFLSYASGGHWHMATQCDTLDARSGGLTCSWEVWGKAEGSVTNIIADSIDPAVDQAGSFPPDTVVMKVQTTTEVDAISFDTVPGAAVYFTPYLDGTLARNDLVVWMSGGTPSMPETMASFWLTPTTP